MATYKRKYYADFQNRLQQSFALTISQRDYTGSAKQIGTLAGCVFELQGNMGDIISPIVKTQLRFSLVDAWDKPATSSYKYGSWEEFFTPDATLYKVTIARYIGTTARVFWTGYITPDSWQEDLDYHGIITVTARDNIGHLADFPFDAEGDENGLIKIADLLDAAMAKIDFPMTYSIQSGSWVKFPEANGVQLHNACVNVSLFDGMDWYEALERSLEAIGYVFRFIDGNQFILTPLRNSTRPTTGGTRTTQEVEFYGGTLEMDPAVKTIEEEQDYGSKNEVELELIDGIQYSSTQSYNFRIEGTESGLGTVTGSADKNNVDQAGKSCVGGNSDLLDPTLYNPTPWLYRSEGDSWKKYLFIAANANPLDSLLTYFVFKTRTTAVRIVFTFADTFTIEDIPVTPSRITTMNAALFQVRYSVEYYDPTSGTTYYWGGAGWYNTGPASVITKDYDGNETALVIDLAANEDSPSGIVTVHLHSITYKYRLGAGKGVYARLSSVNVELLGTKMLQSNKVITINNQANNVQIKRKPLFGALSEAVGFVTPANYEKGLFYYLESGAPAMRYPYMVHFTGQADTYNVPLPVAIHQQILCFYHGAARVLNGNAGIPNKGLFYFNRVNAYKGHYYLFQGGAWDLFSGIITGATFREFVEFDDLWSGGAPEYDNQSEYNQ